MGNSETKKEQKTGFFKTVAVEFKKIIWPSKESVFKQSVAVTAVALAVGVMVALFDFLIQYGVNFITQ
ncbi:MAG: preprotein translocase subunit SecE [Lachnospiraceae bacterium]|nr:preprotein translocase subunit SecE [Lachnospiraceae bacterium]MCR5311148.1 preprotein translocase subunit SecE [Lachnospiraceae bacterium]